MVLYDPDGEDGIDEGVHQYRERSQAWLVTVGCQFTVAGQIAFGPIYPKLSGFQYWGKRGKTFTR